MNNPKFCVGEEVAIDAVPHKIDRTELTNIKRMSSFVELADGSGVAYYDGWAYQTADFDSELWIPETVLRKLPPSKTFDKFMKEVNPKEETA